MCTYQISIDDSLMERVRPAFEDNAAITTWMQSQMEVLLLELATTVHQRKSCKRNVSQRLRGIAHAPADFDYKKELADRMEMI